LSDERHVEPDWVVMCPNCGKIRSVFTPHEQRWERLKLAVTPPLGSVATVPDRFGRVNR